MAELPLSSSWVGKPDVPGRLSHIRSQLKGVKEQGSGLMALCPAHDDTNPSLSITIGDSGKILLYCFAGCSTQSVMQALDLDMAFLSGGSDAGEPDRTMPKKGTNARGWATTVDAARHLVHKGVGTVEAIYDYHDVDNVVRFAVARFKTDKGKTFRPMHLKGGRWHLGDPPRLLPLFQLPAIVSLHEILVVEGEKKVLQAEALGIRATTSSHGANSAAKTDWNHAANKNVVIWPDNDAAGTAYAHDVARILRIINPDIRIRLLTVDGLPEGGDIVDWVSQQREAGLLNEEITSKLRQAMADAPLMPVAETNSADCADSAPGFPTPTWQPPRAIVERVVLPRFPLDEFFPSYHSRLKGFVMALADCYQVPVDAVVLLMLPTIALGLSKRFEVEPLRGWREQLSLYVVVLLQSGERKSAVVRELLNPIYAWQREKANGMADTIRRFDNEETIAKERLDRARKKAAKAQSVDPDLDDLAQQLSDIQGKKPRPPSYVATDGTTEAIARALVLNFERCLLASAEGDALDIMLGRYSGSPNFGVWLSGHSGDAVDSIRRGREADRLVHPALQVLLCVQPEAVGELLGSQAAQGRGVVARFFISAPESKIGFRELLTRPVPTDLADYFGTRVQSHLELPVPAEPGLIRLSPEAHELFTQYRQQNEIDLRPDGPLATCRAWGSKLPGAIARVAGILRAFEPNQPLEIDAETLRCAMSLIPYLTAHYTYVGSLGGSDNTVDIAQRIDAWFRRKNSMEFTKRDAFNVVKGKLKKVEEIEPALALLQERHRIAPAPFVPHAGPGRHPSPTYLVNPALVSDLGDLAQNPHNPQNAAEGGA